MTTTSYTDNEIFINKRVNATCDLLFTKLVEQFPAEISDPDNFFVYKEITLSGAGAAIMQGATVKDLENIVFETKKLEIYEFLQANLQKIFNCKTINFKERTLFYPFDFYFELWYSPLGNKPILNAGIYIQNITDIPSETL